MLLTASSDMHPVLALCNSEMQGTAFTLEYFSNYFDRDIPKTDANLVDTMKYSDPK